MKRRTKGKLLRTAGWITVSIGFYMIYKGTDLEGYLIKDDVIDAKFEVIEE